MSRHFFYAARVALRASVTLVLILALSTLATVAGFFPAAAAAIGLYVFVNLPTRRGAALRHALRWGR